ncbi:hypothetical protein CXB51_004540 [Gossypium anomalum]|uniref:MADS-box domain-containing protein n=1 Tax=Gossypium anomalum TaxID=47600 RepID=A0A8J5Z4R6_9ROSI|nr:hypothetical protein CXB51_004540 [Gossypium anomalum]
MASTGKKTRGRKKTQMKMIENKEDQLVTFSKRRLGIYKKISELSILCGKPFSFGCPSIESVSNRFLSKNRPINDNTNILIEAYRMVRTNKLVQHYNEVHNQMDAIKRKKNVLVSAQQTSETNNTNHWWKTPIHQCNPRELDELYSRFSELAHLFHIAWCKKIANASSMSASTYFGNGHHRREFHLIEPTNIKFSLLRGQDYFHFNYSICSPAVSIHLFVFNKLMINKSIVASISIFHYSKYI